MNRLTLLMTVVVAALFTAGCKSSYEVSYGFVLDGAPPSNPLSRTEGSLEFGFWPTPAGIAFEIRNNSESDAVLEWGDSYFVQPDGNSYNALNTDILDEADEVALKSSNTSIIPIGASLKRFTTASVNAKSARTIRISEVGRYYTATHLEWSSSSGWLWRGPASTTSFSNLTEIDANDSWSVRQYFPSSIVLTHSVERDELKLFANELASESGYALGLTVSMGGESRTYRFSFELDRAFIVGDVEVRDPEGRRSKVRAALYEMTPSEGWTWKALPKPVAPSRE